MSYAPPHQPKFKKRRWHQRRDARFLIVVGVVLSLFYGYGFITGPSRITPRLLTALQAEPDRVNILVTSKFPPEQFHLGIYQELGSMRGSEGNTLLLHRVKPVNVRTLSRYYWIETVDLAKPE
ncbi:MAG: hypothetical protein O3A85_10875 [Proteobacteria bacterium]|nr:hypothetical protein [Pseudomonadota bacterium]